MRVFLPHRKNEDGKNTQRYPQKERPLEVLGGEPTRKQKNRNIQNAFDDVQVRKCGRSASVKHMPIDEMREDRFPSTPNTNRKNQHREQDPDVLAQTRHEQTQGRDNSREKEQVLGSPSSFEASQIPSSEEDKDMGKQVEHPKPNHC